MNSYTINSQALNTPVTLGEATYDNISFNGYGLQNTQIITQGEGFGMRDYPSRRINIIDTPQGDGAILNDTFFSGRTILLSGVLRSGSSYDLNTLIDEFKLNLSFADKVLRWRVNDEIRTVNATVERISFGTKDNIYIPFTVVFISQNAYWSEGSQTSINLTGITSTQTEDISLNVKSVYPKFVIGFNTATVSIVEITIQGIGITITEAITAADILIVDGKEKTITLNGTDIDYDGVFPKLEYGANSLVFTFTGTYNADIGIFYDNNIM